MEYSMIVRSVGIFLMAIGFLFFVFINFKRLVNQKDASIGIKKGLSNNPNPDDDRKKNEAIVQSLDSFLRGSHFYEITGRRGEDKIYKYILNSDKLYQFDGFQAPSTVKIGLDEDFLLFKGMSYKRVIDKKDFSDKFSIGEVALA